MKSEPSVIASLWRRFFADVIDFAILWIFFATLLKFFENWFIEIGGLGQVFGLVVALLYFVPAQSRMGRGRTFGKSAVRIQVLDRDDGESLTIVQSLARFFVLSLTHATGFYSGLIIRVVGIHFANTVTTVTGLVSVLAFFGCYGLILFHPLKLGLHDLVVGSIVVSEGSYDASRLKHLERPEKAKLALIYISVVAFGFIAVASLVSWQVSRISRLDELRTLATNLEGVENISHVTAEDSWRTVNGKKTRSLTVVANVPPPFIKAKYASAYSAIFREMRAETKDLSNYNFLRVGLRTGYNLGLFTDYTTYFATELPGRPGDRISDSSENR